jgi:tetratricopeptide (TPR) repeat protein
MTRKPTSKADPLERDIERALRPGTFIGYRECSSFISDLAGVEAKVASLTTADPGRAASLYETVLAGCHEKAEELDDSGGDFGQFVRALFSGWIKARQAAGTGPEETASRLLVWMDNDPYGFCYQIEADIAKAFNKTGLAAFEKQVRRRFDRSVPAKPAPEGALGDRREHVRRRWGDVLRKLYIHRKNLTAYIALAEEVGPTAQDCRDVASLLASRRKHPEALVWVERGLDLDKKTPYGSTAGHDLSELKRAVLKQLGRGDEAVADAWDDYRKHPSKYTYEDLMKYVPRAERSAWHEKAIGAALGTDLDSLIELFLETREDERLADLVRRTKHEALEQVRYYTAEPAARVLEKLHPDLAARLWRALGMHIVNGGKSKLYDAALFHFERAMRCYQDAGQTSVWERTVRRVRFLHHRKTGFMPGFEKLVVGSGPSDKPSFLERARTRWGKRYEEENL